MPAHTSPSEQRRARLTVVIETGPLGHPNGAGSGDALVAGRVATKGAPDHATIDVTANRIDLTADRIDRIDLTTDVDVTTDVAAGHRAGYSLDVTTRAELESALVARIPPSAFTAGEGIVGVICGPSSPYGDLVRSTEMDLGWGDMPTWMAGYESASIFQFIVDERTEHPGRVRHLSRILCGRWLAAESCGSQVLDSLRGDPTLHEVCAAHGINDLRTCWDVTSTMGAPGSDRSSFPFSGFAFRIGMELLRPFGAEGLFSYVNPLSVRVLQRLGIPFQLLTGREITAPLVDGYEYNSDYVAGVLKVDELDQALHDPSNDPESWMGICRDHPLSVVLLGAEFAPLATGRLPDAPRVVSAAAVANRTSEQLSG